MSADRRSPKTVGFVSGCYDDVENTLGIGCSQCRARPHGSAKWPRLCSSRRSFGAGPRGLSTAGKGPPSSGPASSAEGSRVRRQCSPAPWSAGGAFVAHGGSLGGAHCCLTPRSSGAPTAWHQARAAVRFIICRTGLVPRCRCPLNSHVRHHKCRTRPRASPSCWPQV